MTESVKQFKAPKNEFLNIDKIIHFHKQNCNKLSSIKNILLTSSTYD